MLRSISFLTPLVLAVASCTPPVQKAPEIKAETAGKKATPRPVRMNGRGKVSSISLTEAFTLQQSDTALILDARPRFFYSLGHIPGALSFPKSDCDALIAKHEDQIKSAIAAKKTVVVYCTNLLCPDARTVANHLAGSGYSSSTLTGGWESWKESGLPTE
jgi:rhodanese-related sulfurtransferase